MSYVYVDGVRLSETSPIEFWRKKSYPNVGAVRPRETNRNTRDVCVWGVGRVLSKPVHQNMCPLEGGWAFYQVPSTITNSFY